MVAEACDGLARWLPVSGAIVSLPDDDGTRTHRPQPRSVPPWNPQVANAHFDALEAIRRQFADVSLTVTGRERPLPPHRATGATLTAIVSLSYAVTTPEQAEIARVLRRVLLPVLQLPAIAEQEVAQKWPVPCPRCGTRMVFWWPDRSLLGCGPCDMKARVEFGAVSGEAVLVWADGVVT